MPRQTASNVSPKVKKNSTKKNALAPEQTKIFVLDTNVLMHDPTCMFRFEEHDVFLPIMTLEELDSHKTGMSEISRNVRQTTRTLDDLVAKIEDIEAGIPLFGPSNKLASGRLFLQTEAINIELPRALPRSNAAWPRGKPPRDSTRRQKSGDRDSNPSAKP